MKHFFSVLLLSVSLLSSAHATNEVSNRDALRKQLGLTNYPVGAALKDVKIAVLDNGFAGYAPGKGLLPDSAEMIEGPKNPQAPTPHGLAMAQIAWAVTGQTAAGPKFYLINANGFSNFKAAIDFVIANHVTIVIYSQIWSFGSNFDGTGFINAEVNRATQAGVIWVNASGNNGGMVYNGNVEQAKTATGELRFDSKDYLSFENKVDENPVTLTLSWSDFQDSDTYNTSKDLDLFVYDSAEKLIGSGELVQSGQAPPASGTSNLSSHARESVTLPALDRGKYRIRIKAKSSNFDAKDRFRVMIAADKNGIDFSDHTPTQEIMPPADNATVITVADGSGVSAKGPTADGRRKPDVTIKDSKVTFTNGQDTQGSSNAAALFAGSLAVMKSLEGSISAAGLLRYCDQTNQSTSNLADLHPIQPGFVPVWLWNTVPADGVVMQNWNGRLVVVTSVDPLQLPWFQAAGAYRVNQDDIMVASPFENKWYAIPKAMESQITAPLIEYRQRFVGVGFWAIPQPSLLTSLH